MDRDGAATVPLTATCAMSLREVDDHHVPGAVVRAGPQTPGELVVPPDRIPSTGRASGQ